MESPIGIAPSTSSLSLGDDSQRSQTSTSSVLTFKQAVALARSMGNDLRSHTKDRKWGFKTYSNCFKASHAMSWALKNISSDECIATYKLNQLVEYGLLTHVVDPTRKIRVGETRTLYYRMISDKVLTRQVSRNLENQPNMGRGVPIMSGEFGRSVNDFDLIEHKLQNIDHILNQTVKELNDTRGNLELVHQEVLGLVSQQILTFIMIFLMYTYNIIFMSPPMGWFHTFGLGVTTIMLTRYGWQIISLWSGVERRTMPMETSTLDDQSSVESRSVKKSKSFDRRPTFVSVISKSLVSATGGESFSARKDTAAVIMRDAYSLPNVASWPHRPLLLCANAPVCPDLVPGFGVGPIHLGVPFKFSSDLFEGTCLIRLKGSNSDDTEGDEEYFTGRKRIFQSVVQGCFKEQIPVSDVMTGHEFARPLKNLPHPFILKTATSFIGKVCAGANINVHSDQPFVQTSLAGTSQVVRGDEPGNEPNIACCNMKEDCSVFGSAFSKGNVSISQRKRIFSNAEKCRKYYFDTKTVYTFEFYQNLFDAQSYSLDLGFAKIGCCDVLDGQPIQWLGKLKDGRYLWSFQIWHEKLLANNGYEKNT